MGTFRLFSALSEAHSTDYDDAMQPRLAGYGVDPGVRKRALNQAARIEALGRVAFFHGVSKRNLIRIDQIATIRHVREGDVVMAEGDPGDEMMVVIDGTASVRGGQRELGVCGPGQCVGEMALLDARPRSATVVALEPMRMLVLSGAAFRKLLAKVPHLNQVLLSTLSTRLREANVATDY